MKYLYLHYLNFRLWLYRRRLRKMGLREAARQVNPDTLRNLFKDDGLHHQVEWIKIVLLVLALVSLWLIFWLRTVEPLQIVTPPVTAPPQIQTHSSREVS